MGLGIIHDFTNGAALLAQARESGVISQVLKLGTLGNGQQARVTREPGLSQGIVINNAGDIGCIVIGLGQSIDDAPHFRQTRALQVLPEPTENCYRFRIFF